MTLVPELVNTERSFSYSGFVVQGPNSMTKRRMLLFIFSAPIIFWVLSVVLVLAVGEIGDCEIHEGFDNPCFLSGYNFGEVLYSLGLFAAWRLLLVPILWGYMFVGWGFYEIVAYAYRRLKNK